MRNIAQNDQKSTRIILGRTGFFNGPLVLKLWLIVDQVVLTHNVAYAPWYTVDSICMEGVVYESSNEENKKVK
jgi:hypothetical protein